MSERIEREKSFHNRRFENETRESLNKYYSIKFLIENDFNDLIFRNSKNKSVLEFGCALGEKSFQLAKYAAGVTAIDISEVAIEKAKYMAKINRADNVSFIAMNAEQLEFPPDSFDIVCGVSILHHLDLEIIYSQLSKVLKPSGKAYFIEPLGHNVLINLFRRITPSLRTEDEHPLKIKDLVLLNKYFNVVNIKYYYLFTLFAVLFRSKKYFLQIIKKLDAVDRFLFKAPFIRNQAWQVIIEVGSPRK